ncbi:DegV family protein [Collinsella sp. LCP19S3_C6]|uniref:DegV family protein n=1 Tax=unclassified Collinsella TaxID=2637548 RepID=UPI003F8B1A52
MSFAIITDSTSGISPARAQELGIYVIPLHMIIEGEDLLDQVQASSRRCSIFA